MAKYRIRCQAETGEIISEYYLEARNDKEAALKNHQHPEYGKAAEKALQKGVFSFQYVINPINSLN